MPTMADQADPTPATGSLKVKKKYLNNAERIEIVSFLLGMSKVGPLPEEVFDEMAEKFRCSPRSVRRVWLKADQSRTDMKVYLEEIQSHKIDTGQNSQRYDIEELIEDIKKIPYRYRSTWGALSEMTGVPKSSLLRFKKKGLFRHSSPLKPYLTDAHKAARLAYAQSKINAKSKEPTCFKNHYDEVHVDEKWFWVTEDGKHYILADGEELPKRKVTHKGYITKVMFLSAQARPRIMAGGEYFDGKIGIWPIGEIVPAKRRSANREKGAPTWENHSVDRDKYRQMMIDLVLPAVLEKFPTAYLDRKGVKIQQDGAKSHILPDDPEWIEAVKETGCQITLVTQPAQSPDLNINDLAFFASIMSLQQKSCAKNALELIDIVQKAYEDYPSNKMNRMWLTMQLVMNEIIKDNGGNDYKLPHMNKEKLEREGRLPHVLPVFQPQSFPESPSQLTTETTTTGTATTGEEEEEE
jgi:hypothetical protein